MSENSASVAVHLDSVSKRFGTVTAVDDLTLKILDGEFFSMLGPSGSGKTTVLQMIAGFEDPTTGRIRLGDVDVTRTPPFGRDVNTVFQDYALFPHMDVVTNVEYGLRVKKVPRAERRARARHQPQGTAPPEVYGARNDGSVDLLSIPGGGRGYRGPALDRILIWTGRRVCSTGGPNAPRRVATRCRRRLTPRTLAER